VTPRDFPIGGKVLNCGTALGLDAGSIYALGAVRRRRTIPGTVATVTVQVGPLGLVDVKNPAIALRHAHVEAYGASGPRVDAGVGRSRMPRCSIRGASAMMRRCLAGPTSRVG
jgi:hypothetical protein